MTGRPSGRCAAQDLLADARPYVYGATHDPHQPWRRETGQTILEAIDAALASPCCVSAPDQEQVKEALQRIAERQPETLAMIRRHGFVFATPVGKPDEERTEAERWEKLAFSIYTDLCEVDSIAEAALALLGSPNEQED